MYVHFETSPYLVLAAAFS